MTSTFHQEHPDAVLARSPVPPKLVDTPHPWNRAPPKPIDKRRRYCSIKPRGAVLMGNATATQTTALPKNSVIRRVFRETSALLLPKSTVLPDTFDKIPGRRRDRLGPPRRHPPHAVRQLQAQGRRRPRRPAGATGSASRLGTAEALPALHQSSSLHRVQGSVHGRTVAGGGTHRLGPPSSGTPPDVVPDVHPGVRRQHQERLGRQPHPCAARGAAGAEASAQTEVRRMVLTPALLTRCAVRPGATFSVGRQLAGGDDLASARRARR